MHAFVGYSLIASALWGVMSITEAYAGGLYNESALLLKFAVFGAVGVGAALVALSRGAALSRQYRAFARERPGLLLWLVVAIALGALGTAIAYRAYAICGKNRGVTVAITYGAPLVIVTLASALVLRERLRVGALVGVLLILLGIYVVDQFGVNQDRGA